ncbi:hypothetical protein [Scandinavium manionii]|uniref:hypothetical protein n=1 Tax=Scandinavium manionii TaxID=2926520 RepID=UPI00216698A8|nr:hypothetical protein [Scandinavium manionii]MCS2166299.1 hypothetical protein [Scandinavium manionii]HDM8271860.1 hypothetical protein [Yersinia enterocolitica]HED5564730.1 hypothetical protein [Yersinia enterocolitica]
MNAYIDETHEKIIDLFKHFEEYYFDGDIARGVMSLNKFNYSFCYEYSNISLISGIFSIKGRDDLNQEFVDINTFNNNFFTKNFSMIISLDMKKLRSLGLAIYKDLNEAINLSPKAKEKFILIQSPDGKTALYPNETIKGHILHYIQISKVWEVLVNSSDDDDGNSCTFLGARKSFVSLHYELDDLDLELDGFSKFMKLMDLEDHKEEKNKILSNTIFSFTSNKDLKFRFRTILKRFSTFVERFEENYHAFAVGFSFEKIRNEYEEKFRDYLSKINSVLSESLTRSLAIPASTVLTFTAIKSSSEGQVQDILLNSGTFFVSLFVLFTTFFTVKFQLSFLKITKDEFLGLFSRFESELDSVNLSEARDKFDIFSSQVGLIKKLLLFILSMSITNFIINLVSFVIVLI